MKGGPEALPSYTETIHHTGVTSVTPSDVAPPDIAPPACNPDGCSPVGRSPLMGTCAQTGASSICQADIEAPRTLNLMPVLKTRFIPGGAASQHERLWEDDSGLHSERMHAVARQFTWKSPLGTTKLCRDEQQLRETRCRRDHPGGRINTEIGARVAAGRGRPTPSRRDDSGRPAPCRRGPPDHVRPTLSVH